MEPEPVDPALPSSIPAIQYAEPDVPPQPARRGSVGRILAAAFVLGFGCLLLFGLARGLAARILHDDTTVKWWGFVILLPVGLIFTAVGFASLWMEYLTYTGRNVWSRSARWVDLLWRLFHVPRGG